MDSQVSFKVALLLARRAELTVRGGCLSEPVDLNTLKSFEVELDGALERLRQAGTIPDHPLADFLSQCATVIGWERKLAAEEAFFAEVIASGFAEFDELIAQGLPEAEWTRFRDGVANLDSDFANARTLSQKSVPRELWPIVSGSSREEATANVIALIRHASEGGLLNPARGWAGPQLDMESETFGMSPDWTDHFDPGDDARSRIASRPAFDATELARLREQIQVAEERKDIWQKYFPRIQATTLPIRTKQAYELIVKDPGEVVGQLTECWPEVDRRLSARVMTMFESGDLGLAEGVALLATDKDALKAETAAEIRARILALPGKPLFSAADVEWICDTPGKVKTVYTARMEESCTDYNWKHGFSVSAEVEAVFAQGTNVAEGLAAMLEGKSKKHLLGEEEVEKVFNQLRMIPEISEDFHSIDCSRLENSTNLPDGWSGEYWRSASFEVGDWVVGNPMQAVRLLSSELPQIVEEYTGRRQLSEWRDTAQPLLDDESLTISGKAMLLPVMLGLSNDIPFLPEKPVETKDADKGEQKLSSLKEEVERPFRKAEVNELLASGFAEKLARYGGQDWLQDTVNSRAETRNRVARFSMKAVVAIGAAVVLLLAVAYFVSSARNRAAMSEQEREAALKRMVLDVEVDFSAAATSLEKGSYRIELDGNPLVVEVENGSDNNLIFKSDFSKTEPGQHVLILDHPRFKVFRKDVEIAFGEGIKLGRVKLEPASAMLDLQSDPSGASVSINGSAIGQTPLKVAALPVGTNTIELSSVEFGAFTTNAAAVRDQPLSVLHRFASGIARVETTPAGFYGGIERVTESNSVIRFQPEWNKTPLEQKLSPGEYMFALVHPTMGGLETTRFEITDLATNQLVHQFPVGKPAFNGLPATPGYWRGVQSLNKWLDWDASWQFSTKNRMTLFRLWKPGFLPQVYPLEYRADSGSFSSLKKSAMQSGGTIECWGVDSKGQCTVPDEFKNRKFIDIAAGANHTVGLTEDLKVVAWGDNSLGQCNVPADLGPCMMVAAGDNHTVILRADGKVMAWGDNRAGQSAIPDEIGYCVAITASGNRSGALNQDGSIEGWGYGKFTIAPRTQWRPFIDLSFGPYYISALDDQGQPAIYIQTKEGAGSPPSEVAEAAAGGPLIATAAGKTFTLWVNAEGKMNGIGRDPLAKRLPDSAAPFLSVATGDSRHAAVCVNGNIVIWGTKAGVSERYGFERQIEESSRLGFWRMKGSFSKVVCGQFHYVAIKR